MNIERILERNDFVSDFFIELKNNNYLVIGLKSRFVSNKVHTYHIKVKDSIITYESILTHTSFPSVKKASHFLNDSMNVINVVNNL